MTADIQQLLEAPHGIHLYVTALLGRTAEHLREEHRIEPTPGKRTNAGLHYHAHRVPAPTSPSS